MFSIVALVALVASASPVQPYGVVTDATRSEYGIHEEILDMVRAGGMGAMRVDWDWSACQANQGDPFDFSKYDKLVDNAEKRGITILPIVYGPPSWARPVWQHIPEFAEFVKATVGRYGTRMPVIEIWNEENSPGFWPGAPDPTNYVALLRAAYRASKETNPEVKVAVGGTAGWALDYFRSCFQLGLADCYDIMNCHPYCYPSQPEFSYEKTYAALRELMSKYGDEKKPVWFTEIGWPTQDANVLGEGNFASAGLKIARPDKKTWRLIYAPCLPEGSLIDPIMGSVILASLPLGSEVRVATPKEVVRLLKEGGWDAVLYPPGESYPSETLTEVIEFVKNGGTLIDLGGMPLWNNYFCKDGVYTQESNGGSWGRFAALHIGLDSWWLDGSKLPQQHLQVYGTPEGLAAGLEQSPTGFKCGHFFSDKALKPGDEMIPLVSGKNPNNGEPAVAACVYRLNSDMKGCVILSGIASGRGTSFVTSEDRQGVMYARSLGISFALGLEANYWYNLRAREWKQFYNEDHFGMVHANMTPKMGFLANLNFIKNRPVGSVNLNEKWRDGSIYYPQWKLPNGKIGGMIWSLAKGNMRLVFASNDVKLQNMWGRPEYVRDEGNGVRVFVIGEEPIYFTGARLLSCSPQSK